MARTNVCLLMLGSASLFIAVGCAHNQPQSSSGFSEIQQPLQPTSSSSAQSVYATAPVGARATVTTAPTGASSESWDLAESVRQLLLTEPKLAPWPSKIIATVDKNSKGGVIVSGNVPTKSVKQRLIQRISALPGVTHVEDQLSLGPPKHPGELNIKELSEQK